MAAKDSGGWKLALALAPAILFLYFVLLCRVTSEGKGFSWSIIFSFGLVGFTFGLILPSKLVGLSLRYSVLLCALTPGFNALVVSVFDAFGLNILVEMSGGDAPLHEGLPISISRFVSHHESLAIGVALFVSYVSAICIFFAYFAWLGCHSAQRLEPLGGERSRWTSPEVIAGLLTALGAFVLARIG